MPPPAGYCTDPLVPFNSLDSYPTLLTTPQTGGNDYFPSASILNDVSNYSVLPSTSAIPFAEYAVIPPTFDSTTNQALLSLATLPKEENWPDGTSSLTTLRSPPLFASPTTDTTYSAGCSPLNRFKASPGLYDQSTSCSQTHDEQVTEHITNNSTYGSKPQGGQKKRIIPSVKPKDRKRVLKPKGKEASASTSMPGVASISPPLSQPNC